MRERERTKWRNLTEIFDGSILELSRTKFRATHINLREGIENRARVNSLNPTKSLSQAQALTLTHTHNIYIERA
jgi:hypothetical protein